jgi:hypothetical protein
LAGKKEPVTAEAEGGDKKKSPEDYSKPGSLPFEELWGSEVKYSDQLANGDDADDKELEDEDDPNDLIVDDNGFVNAFDIDEDKAAQWVQLDSDINVGKTRKTLKLVQANNNQEARFSDELVDGDQDDDDEIADLNDQDDDEVDENLAPA